MATLSSRALDRTIAVLIIGLLSVPSARSVTITGGRLVEDFSTDEYADYTASTGLWNLQDRVSRAGVVVGGVASQTVPMGDGSDGVLDSSTGATLNTDSHPNGFNFRRVNVTGGTLQVSGRNPLIIRSLTTIDIGAGVVFSLDGAPGTNGALNASTSGSGGRAITCSADGGSGANALATAISSIALDGFLSSGAVDIGNLGLSVNNNTDGFGPANNASNSSAPTPNAATFYAGGFICGAGGAGGGANTEGVVAGNFATGGGGGAGGGRVRISAVGPVTIVPQITARGGNSGRGRGDNVTVCSGSGAGGDGGAIWLQSLSTVTNAGGRDVSGGTGLDNTDCTGFGANPGPGPSNSGSLGADRIDAAAAHVNGGLTLNAAPNQSYIIQSKAYDLGTLNADFKTVDIGSATPGGGRIAVEYAASVDGQAFSPFTSDIKTLSDKQYRYLKFKITIVTAGVAALSPQVSQIAIDYTDLGLAKLDLKLVPGCGTIAGLSDGGSGRPGAGLPSPEQALSWALFWLMAYRLLRYGSVLKTRRLASITFPARSVPPTRYE